MPSELFVGEDQVFVVTEKNVQKYVYVDNLIMENNSRIEVRVDWQFNAKNVVVGTGCLIEASGLRGNNGHHVTAIPNQTGECNRGDDNNAAPNHGGIGGRGRNLTFNWGIESIGGLTIRSNGGHGGNGGNGAPGGMGGGARCHCRGGNGGTGSPGGNAGPGGDSGRIVLRWTPRGATREALSKSDELKEFANNIGQKVELLSANKTEDLNELFAQPLVGVGPTGLTIEALAGQNGSFGLGGGPSSGGAGQNCGPWGVGWVVAGGDEGARGSNGAPARPGNAIPPVVELA